MTRWLKRLFALLLAAWAGIVSAQVLDDFRQADAWTAIASDQVKASLRRDARAGLCLDYDFAGVSGYAVMRRALPMDWPTRFDLTARLSGSGGRNDLQIKLVDASGDNVWWLNRPNEALPLTPTDVKVRSRQISFAWGPGADRSLRRTEFVEFVIAAGRDGGRGALCLDRLSLVERAADPLPWPQPVQRGSSVDFQLPREFNGVALRWPTRPGDYEVQASDDGRQWRSLRRVRSSDGGLDALFLPDSEARYLRVRASSRPKIELRSAAEWPSFNAVLAELARDAPRGDLPRAFVGEQNYWTLVGVDGGGQRSALLSEDGALEIGRGGYSIEPAVQLDDGRPVTWAGVKASQSLRDGYLPQPAVHWQHAAFTLDIEAAADGPAAAPELLARYRLRNTGGRPQTFILSLALRPWQVNPPQQFLSTPGGASPVSTLRWQGGRLSVDGVAGPRFSSAPQRVSALPLDGGASLVTLLNAPGLSTLADPQHHASAALQFRIALAPGESKVIGFVAPLGGNAQANTGRSDARSEARPDARLDARFDAAAVQWRERLNHLQISLPPAALPVVDTLRSSLAHILMSRDGAALRPGTRSYARTWVRDGAMMVAGLLRLGELAASREFVDWYANYIFASGKVPCCVDQRGADPVVENDSHGQYLYTVAEVWRHTQDRAFLLRHWPQVQRVTAWMEGLRQSERTALNQTPERAHLFGLMPPSISHEGYSDKPAYSLWDDFWALRGYKDAVILAAAAGEPEQAARWAAWRDEFQRELVASTIATAAKFKLTSLAGAADRGDVDPTSSTMALNPAQAQDVLPPVLLRGTFERYWTDAQLRTQARADGSKPWKDYTPYELRTVGALLRLGQPERAHAMLDFFFKDQRPAGWNQWAEVVLPGYRQVGFLGDMPHAWISSDYIRSALDLFAYEVESPAALVIGAGLKPEWLAAGDISLRDLSTAFGPLSYRLLRTPGGWMLHLDQAGAPTRLVWQGRELPLLPAPSTLFLPNKGLQ